MKDETRKEGCQPVEIGKFSTSDRSDLTAMYQMAVKGKSERDIADSFSSSYIRFQRGLKAVKSFYLPPREDKPVVCLLIGPPGSGKTFAVHEAAKGDLYTTPPDSGVEWFDGMDQNDDVLLDDFAGKMSKSPLSSLLQILDSYPIRVAIKGGFTAFTAKRIFITTNYHPRDWYDWTTREPQWFALVRRFTHVFKFTVRGDEPTVYIRGAGTQPSDWTYEWRSFWGHPLKQIEISKVDCVEAPLRRVPPRKTSEVILNKILKKESIKDKRERKRGAKLIRKYLKK